MFNLYNITGMFSNDEGQVLLVVVAIFAKINLRYHNVIILIMIRGSQLSLSVIYYCVSLIIHVETTKENHNHDQSWYRGEKRNVFDYVIGTTRKKQ